MFRHLRQGGKRRRKRTYGPEKRRKLANKPMIDTRPEAVEGRQEVGHWEGDTVMSAAWERSCLLILVERSAGFAQVAKLPHRTVKAVNRATLEVIKNSALPFKTITWDNGTELHGFLNGLASTGSSGFRVDGYETTFLRRNQGSCELHGGPPGRATSQIVSQAKLANYRPPIDGL